MPALIVVNYVSMSGSWRRKFAPYKRDAVVGFLIFAAVLSTFLISRIHTVSDSRYTLLLSQSLLERGSFNLDDYRIPDLERTNDGFTKPDRLYQLEIAGGHVYYLFPPGSSILSLPYVALMKLFGVTAADTGGNYNVTNEVMLQTGLSALLMAALASVFFFTARIVLPAGWSALVAVGGALGTQVWSTASRALWSDTWGIFLLGIVAWMLLAEAAGKARLRPVLLATLLAWLYFVRPTYSIPILAISIYLFFFHRRLIVWYAVTGIFWLALFVGYSWYHFGQLLPSYYWAGRLTFDHFGEALAGNLISPGRGLLLFVPATLFVFYLLARYRKRLSHTRLVVLALSVITVHWVATSGYPHWYGGHSFGPRLMTGVVPWLVLLAMLGLEAMLKQRAEQEAPERRARWRIEGALGAMLLLASVTINCLGATSHAVWLWNMRPVDVDQQPSRIWDWRHPQFLAK